MRYIIKWHVTERSYRFGKIKIEYRRKLRKEISKEEGKEGSIRKNKEIHPFKFLQSWKYVKSKENKFFSKVEN